jgi:hypothetical protein
VRVPCVRRGESPERTSAARRRRRYARPSRASGGSVRLAARHYEGFAASTPGTRSIGTVEHDKRDKVAILERCRAALARQPPSAQRNIFIQAMTDVIADLRKESS